MSANPFAVADTCFLIDWASWRRRNVLFSIFRTVFVPENVLKEVRSENTIEWIASSLASGSMSLFTETSEELSLAREIVERSRMIPSMRYIDIPEAICLALGKLRGYFVLTENRGALMASDLIEELSGVTVWRSLEVITRAISMGVIAASDPLTVFREYEEDTKHVFPRSELEAVVFELRGEA